MRKSSTRMLVEAGAMIAMAQILSYLKIYELPNGGSITAGSMVPILIFAIRWGMKPGLLAGIAYGIFQFLLGGSYAIHPVSIILDYLAAFGLLGLAGISPKNLLGTMFGVFLGVFGRFAASVISGATIWAAYAPETMNPWVYSILYNGSYMLPELVISIVLVSLLYRSLKKIPLSSF